MQVSSLIENMILSYYVQEIFVLEQKRKKFQYKSRLKHPSLLCYLVYCTFYSNLLLNFILSHPRDQR